MPRLSNAQLWDRTPEAHRSGPRPPEPRRNKRRQEESRMQRALVRWFDLNAKAAFGVNPLVLFSSLNAGLRGEITGAILKAGGLRAGVPDLQVCVARSDCHGLFLELKTPEGRVSPEQEVYHTLLREQGYRVEVIRSFDQGVEVISNYLKP